MKNLPRKYREIFKIINKKCNIQSLSEDSSYAELNKTYNIINDILENNNYDAYELNNIINSDILLSSNDHLKDLKKFIYLRNKAVLKKAADTKLWTKNIENITNYCKECYDIITNYDIVEDAFIQLEKTFIFNWMGFWSTIDVSKNGRIKDINIFDINDYDYIINYVKLKK